MKNGIPTAESFFEAVRLLRQMPRRYQAYATFAAEFWTDEKLETAIRNGDVPGNSGTLMPEGASVQ